MTNHPERDPVASEGQSRPNVALPLASVTEGGITIDFVSEEAPVDAVLPEPIHQEGDPTIETILTTPWGLRVDNVTTYTRVIQNNINGRKVPTFVPNTTKQKAYIEDEQLNPFDGYVANLLLALRLELDKAREDDPTLTRVSVKLADLAHDIDDRIIDETTAKHTPLKNLAQSALVLRQRLEHHGFAGRLLIEFPPTAHPGHRNQVANMHVSLDLDSPMTDIERAAKDRLVAEKTAKESQAPRKVNL